MANNLTLTGANQALSWMLGLAATAPSGQLKVALLTVNGTDTAAGTEVTGGSYVRKNLTPATVSAKASSNSADLTWTGMPACTVVGVEIYDSAGTPVRWWYGPLAVNKVLAANDEFRLPAGSLTFGLT